MWEAETSGKLLYASVLIAGCVIAISSLRTADRRGQDWMMCVGALMATLAEGVLGLMIFGRVNINSETVLFMLFGCLGFGTLLFVMGFLFDQLQWRRLRKREEEFNQMNLPQ